MENLHLTFIPSEYWTSGDPFFVFLDRKTLKKTDKIPIPKDASFFVVWLNDPTASGPEGRKTLKEHLDSIDSKIRAMFPSIPIDKLNIGLISLAFPISSNNESVENELEIRRTIGRIFPLSPMIPILFKMKIFGNETDYNPSDRKGISPGGSFRTWSYLTKFVIELLSRGSFVPRLEIINEDDENKSFSKGQPYHSHYKASWKIILRNLHDWRRFNTLLKRSPWAAYNLPIRIVHPEGEIIRKGSEKPLQKMGRTDSIWNNSYLFIKYMNLIADYLIRSSLGKGFTARISEIYGIREENNDKSADSKIYDSFIDSTKKINPWDYRFLLALTSKDKSFIIRRFSESPIPEIINGWSKPIEGFPFHLGIMFTFKLEYPETADGDWRLRYYFRPLQKSEQYIGLDEFWNCTLETRKEIEMVCEDIELLEEEVFKSLGIASLFFPPIERSLEDKYPHEIILSPSEVMHFLKESSRLLINNGYNVELPEEFLESGERRVTASIEIYGGDSADNSENLNMIPAQTDGFSSLPEKEVHFGAENIFDYRWKITIEGKELSESEIHKLIAGNEPLINIDGKWILINPDDLRALREIFNPSSFARSEDQSIAGMGDGAAIFDKLRKPKGQITYLEAIKLGLAGVLETPLGTHHKLELKGKLRNLINRLKEFDKFTQLPTPALFNGKLRPYQVIGFSWLYHMHTLGFGACLADDMGLGKTIQVIAYLARMFEDINDAEQIKKNKNKQPGLINPRQPILIICPTSVIYNWKREIERFAPRIPVIIHHGPQRPKGGDILSRYTGKMKVILTTYGTIRNDIEFMESLHYNTIILDESQNIKNYRTQKALAIYRLRASFRIALSGTPIENRLMELWSLFEFINPGLLGSRESFKKRFITPIENFQDRRALELLHKLISPFILRRVKTDKSIINDLPPKNEIKIVVELTDFQKRLYTAVVNRILGAIQRESENKRKRRGQILKLITYIKQICNHPLHFLYANPEYIGTIPSDYNELIIGPRKKNKDKPAVKRSEKDPGSGNATINGVSLKKIDEISVETLQLMSLKLNRLIEMVEEVIENNEKCLIFTQYTEMGKILSNIMSRAFNIPIYFYHGSLSKEQRQRIIDGFQAGKGLSPILILSLRAGGTGLNLTSATTVFHFDRWWNPAVEDQATDRAYRIGQTQRVNVIKFIAAGTIEEKIDKILEEKRDLADKIITTTGDKFITELNDEELQELFTLAS